MLKYSDYTQLIFEQVEAAVRDAQRELRRGVLPKDVQPRLPYSRAEGSLRRDMVAMYESGRLVRVGGYGARRGYRLPTRLERLAWTINRGLWPYGAEELVLWAS